MNETTTRAILVAVAVLFVACGALAGAAAADQHGDDETTVGEYVEVGDEDNGGEGGFECTGEPTDHDCEKEGEASAGPADAEYEGFNGGSYEEGEYDFGDTFVVTGEDGDGAVVGFECDLEDEAPEDNPCPVTAEEYEGNPGNGDGGNSGEQGDGQGSGDGADGGNGSNDDGERSGSTNGDAGAPSHAQGPPGGSSSGVSYLP